MFCVSGSGTIIVRLIYAVLCLPVVSLFTSGWFGFQVFKQTIDNFKVTKQIANADGSKKEELEEEQLKTQAKQREGKGTLQVFKLYECCGESGPQAILQTAIVMKKAETFRQTFSFLKNDFLKSYMKSTLLFTILSSMLSLVFTGGSLLVESPFCINGSFINPYHSVAQTLAQSSLMSETEKLCLLLKS